MYINQIFSGYNYRLCGEDKNIHSLAVHSAFADVNCLFFAHKGRKNNGNDYVHQAVENGAVAICTEEEYVADTLNGKVSVVLVNDSREAEGYAAARFYSREYLPKIVGVTGTNGKTSVCHIAKRVFDYLGMKSSYTGTLGTDISDGIALSNTTFPPSLFHQLRFCAAGDHTEYIFSELSSQGIMDKRCEYTDYHTLVFTNLTHDHLDTHGSMEEYYNVKAGIFRNRDAFFVMNIDDLYGRRLYDEIDGVKISVGFLSCADICISEYAENEFGICFLITFLQEDTVYIKVPLHGKFNALNIAVVCGVLYMEGVNPVSIASAVNASLTDAVRGRMEQYTFEGITVYVDFAHTPDAMRNVFESVTRLCSGKILCVFGCGGERDRSKRDEMGRIACSYCDTVIITSDNNRSECFFDIASDIVSGCGETELIVVRSRKKAIIRALGMASEGDCVMILGRGAENCMYDGDEQIFFSDCEFMDVICR